MEASALIQVRSKLRDAFQKEILIVEMFEYPTIRALVERLTNLSDDRVRLQRVEELARTRRQLSTAMARLPGLFSNTCLLLISGSKTNFTPADATNSERT